MRLSKNNIYRVLDTHIDQLDNRSDCFILAYLADIITSLGYKPQQPAINTAIDYLQQKEN